MGRDLNRFDFEGRIVADPETREVGGSSVTSWRVAIDTSYKKKDSDEWVNQAVFIAVQAWNGLGEKVAATCKKGDFVRMSTQLIQRSWEDADGNKRSTIEAKLVNSFDWRKLDLVKKSASTSTEESDESTERSEAKKRGRPAKKAEPKPKPEVVESDDDEEEIDF